MPFSSLFKRSKHQELPYRRDPSVDLAGEYASDQLDPTLQLHWAGNPDVADTPAPVQNNTARGPGPARYEHRDTEQQRRQTTLRALQTIRERQAG